jgi:hypothetical protein
MTVLDYYNNSIDVYKQGLEYFEQTFKKNEDRKI